MSAEPDDVVRRAVLQHDPGYPAAGQSSAGLSRGDVAHSPREGAPEGADVASRRALLKLLALSAAAATLGLELVGCPGGGGGGGGGGTEWLPWEPDQHIEGGPSLMVGTPVAVVAGGGPIAVTFRDGSTADLVVAAVAVPYAGADVSGEVVRRAAEHAELVRREAAQVAPSALASATERAAFEARLLEALNAAAQGGYFTEVSAARALPPAAPAPVERESQGARSEAARAPGADAGPVTSSTTTAVGGPSRTRRLWTPCGRSGCTTCGAR